MSLGVLLQSLTFTTPWILAALIALPLLWWLLRILPPAPRLVAFPAIRLLLGLQTEQKAPDSAPWWLILLRLLAAALAILAFAHPVLNPQDVGESDGPMILVVDNDWSAAGGWEDRRGVLLDLVQEASRAGRQVHLLATAPSTDGSALQDPGLVRPAEAEAILRALDPVPWAMDWPAAAAIVENWSAAAEEAGRAGETARIYWAWNGRDGEGLDALSDALGLFGSVTMLNPDAVSGPVAIDPPLPETRDLEFTLRRGRADVAETFGLIARAGDGRALDRVELNLQPGESEAVAVFDLPAELRNALVRVELDQARGAGAVALIDERWRRRPVGLVSETELDTAPSLLSEAYYVRRALEPLGDLSQGPVQTLLRADQATIVAPDSASLSPADRDALAGWIERGGVLIRFAGPDLAADREDTLTPVSLRGGGRVLDGAMVWSEPLTLGQFSRAGPFSDLAIPDDVTVTRQVLAEPSLELDSKTWARLSDGTPLITAEQRGEGWLVLVHTTANAEWSSLALSGTFVDILERLIRMSRGVAATDTADLLLPPQRVLDGFGRLGDPGTAATPIAANRIAEAVISPQAPPGFYGSDVYIRALNIARGEPDIAPPDTMPAGVSVRDYQLGAEIDLKPDLLLLTFILVIADGLITLYLRGFFSGIGLTGRRASASVLLLAAVTAGAIALPGGGALAQSEDERFIASLDGTVLAYVITGNRQVDEASRAGLTGLAQVLLQRTAVEASQPQGVDVRRDELSFYPLLYWPVTDNQTPPDPQTVRRLNAYMATGGTILFDTRDQAMAGLGGSAGRALRRISAGLDIPPLKPIGPEHVLTKSFYLMQDFPGRWNGGELWVESDEATANDGVSRIIVGGNDWAGAWAVDDRGRPIYPTVPGGDRQRELAYRFGVNLVMYTLTGNYKADQVHIPAILERLGQ